MGDLLGNHSKIRTSTPIEIKFLTNRSGLVDVVFGYKNDYAWAQYLMDKFVADFNMLANNHNLSTFVAEPIQPIEKGTLTWQVMNLHVYSRHFDLVK